jgi:hypothetical protein
MGCGCSKSEEDVNLGGLAPHRPGQSGQGYDHDVDLTAENLDQALDLMAKYIAKRKRNVTIVVVGGVVSTMLLHTRRSTQDIDFFSEKLTREDAKLLMEASRSVRGRIRDPTLGSGWFNNKTTYFINSDVRARLAAEGYQQNAIVFQASGLTLLAAPWAYQFCAKIHRMAGGGGKSHDAGDAAGYLYRYLQSQHIQAITVGQIQQLIQKYKIQGVAKNGLPQSYQAINEAFAARYGNVYPIVN